MKNISKNLRSLIGGRKINISELAQRANIPKHQMYNIINGRSQNLDVLYKITNILGITLEDLLQDSLTAIEELNKSTKATIAIIKKDEEINPEEYIKVVNCLKEVIREFNIIISLHQFEKIANLMYSYHNLVLSYHDRKILALGMVLHSLESINKE